MKIFFLRSVRSGPFAKRREEEDEGKKKKRREEQKWSILSNLNIFTRDSIPFELDLLNKHLRILMNVFQEPFVVVVDLSQSAIQLAQLAS